MSENKTITLRERPRGAVTRDTFGFEARPEPTLSPAHVVLRPLYVSVDPYMRGRMNDRKSYIAPFQVGAPIQSAAVARVIAANPDGRFQVGQLVTGVVPWQERSAVPEQELRAVDGNAPLTAQLGILGSTGLTAYVGLFDIGQPKPGETVFVSGAAGAVGSVVGQLAKIHGCRAVGSAGSDEKVRWLVDELGFDAAFNYKTCGKLVDALRRTCPGGIDVYFDNVGGATLEAVLYQLNVHARVAVCGSISSYQDEAPSAGPRNLFTLVQNRVRMEGFLVLDHLSRMKEFAPAATRWLAEGKLKDRETVVDGFDALPDAFIGLMRGDNLGKMLVRVSAD